MPAKRYADGVLSSTERLNERFARWGPFRLEGRLAPVSIHVGEGALGLTMPPGRTRAWRAGWERAAGDSLCARWLDGDEGAVVLAASAEVLDPTEALLRAATERAAVRGTRRAVLERLGDEVRLDRALGRVGLPRRHVDRYLDAAVEFQTEALRTGFGGLGPRWWRERDGQPVAIRLDRARAGGWLALELAALGHEEDGEAFELARLAIALREATLGGDPGTARAVAAEIVRPATTPAEVTVWIEGPELVRDLWEPAGARVSPRRARWLLQHVDGLSIAGAPVRVRVEPSIRAGRRPPRREPRASRRRRLFTLWDRGVRVDDVGLVGLTPERMALSIAARVPGLAPAATVIDGTCGVGGLALALARTPAIEHVIAVDVDAGRLEMARHNAQVYGVTGRIEFVLGDVVELLARRRAEVLVLDPPWGGRAYDRERVTLADLPMPVSRALERFDGVVLLKLPRSFDPSTLPGAWTLELLLDEREIPKMLLATRRPRKS